MAVDVIRRAAEGVVKGRELRRDLGRDRRAIEPPSSARAIMAPIGRNAPRRAGAKPGVSGRNGAVSVRCRPIATRVAAPSRVASDRASARVKLGATTITEVALSRPRATRSRIAALTAGDMP